MYVPSEAISDGTMPKKPALPGSGDPILVELRRLREKAGLTQGQAGERLGVSQQQYWKYENGVTALRVDTYRDILRIFGGEDQERPAPGGMSEDGQAPYVADEGPDLQEAIAQAKAAVDVLTSFIEKIERR